MYMVAYIFKRVPGMSLEDFLHHYEHLHGPLMVKLLKDKGLISYEHHPVRSVSAADIYVAASGPAYDAISIYTFVSSEAAANAWPIPEIVEDSERFIDFETMVMLPITKRVVFPEASNTQPCVLLS